jgi:hypothetical protein
MVAHFYRLTVCLPLVSNIELTSDVKNHIIKNHTFPNELKSSNSGIIHKTTNNTNNINYNITINCVNNMSLDKKIQLMIAHMGMTIEPIHDCIRKRTQHFIENKGKLKGVDDLKMLAQYICKPLTYEIFNPAYIKKENMCSTLVCSTLDDDDDDDDDDSEDCKDSKHSVDSERIKESPLRCLKAMLTILQEQTSGDYEIELVKRHHSGLQGSREDIIELYSFYKEVGIVPYVHDMADSSITYNGNMNEYSIAERHMKLFNTCKKTKNTTELLDIMKSFCNVSKLNDMMVDKAKNSEEFNLAIM